MISLFHKVYKTGFNRRFMKYKPSREFRRLVNSHTGVEDVIDGAMLEVQREFAKREKHNQRVESALNWLSSGVVAAYAGAIASSTHPVLDQFCQGNIRGGILYTGLALFWGISGYHYTKEIYEKLLTPQQKFLRR